MPRRPCRPIIFFRTSNDPLFILTLWYVSLSFLKPLVRSLFLLCVIVPLVILIRFSFTCSIAYTTNMHCFLGALGFTVHMHLSSLCCLIAPPYQIHTQSFEVL